MERECEKRLKKIVEGFQECRNAFTAIGDETRQLILLVLLESDLSGIRVGEIAQKAHLTRPSVSHHLQIPVSYTHLDVYKRQPKGTGGEKVCHLGPSCGKGDH